MISQIKKRLNSEILNPTKINQFNRNHIFYDLKNTIIDSSDKKSLMDLHYCFSLYEKCLMLCRENSLNLASYWFSKIDIIHSKLSNDILQCLFVLYKPCLAYFHYKKGNMKVAVDLLSVVIDKVELFNFDQILKLEIKLEQLINKYRVFISAGDYENATILAKNIILYVVNNKKNDYLPNDNILCLKKDNIENYLSWVNFLIDNIVSKIQYDNSILTHEKEKLYYDIFGNIELNNNLNLNNAFLAIKFYYEESDANFLKHILESFKEINKLPIKIQEILLYFLVKRKKIDLKLYKEYLATVLKK